MIRVGVLGAAGRMGQEVCRAVISDPDLELVAAIDTSIGAGRLAIGELHVSPSVTELLETSADVAVDFTVARAVMENLRFVAGHGIDGVCGTTGISEADRAELEQLFGPKSAPNCVLAPNFAISSVVMMKICEIAAAHMESVEVIELHHDEKVDSPSGTALETARRVAVVREGLHRAPIKDPTTSTVLDGARGGVGPGEIHVHSIRLPGLVAHQEVIFGAMGQALTIRQDSFDRSSFMPGVLLALKAVSTTPGLTFGLEALLGLV